MWLLSISIDIFVFILLFYLYSNDSNHYWPGGWLARYRLAALRLPLARLAGGWLESMPLLAAIVINSISNILHYIQSILSARTKCNLWYSIVKYSDDHSIWWLCILISLKYWWWPLMIPFSSMMKSRYTTIDVVFSCSVMICGCGWSAGKSSVMLAVAGGIGWRKLWRRLHQAAAAGLQPGWLWRNVCVA